MLHLRLAAGKWLRFIGTVMQFRLPFNLKLPRIQ